MLPIIKLATPSAVQLTRVSFALLQQLCPHCLDVKLKFFFACLAGSDPVNCNSLKAGLFTWLSTSNMLQGHPEHTGSWAPNYLWGQQRSQ